MLGAFKEISSQSAVRFNSMSLLSNNSRLQHDSGNENSNPTHAQIDFQTRGETRQLAVSSVFGRWFRHRSNGHAEAFNDVKVPRCWVICLAPYHLQVGPYCWSGIPTMGPFPSALYLLIPLAHPSACTGSLFSLPALLRGLCGPESRNPSGLCVYVCVYVLYSFMLYLSLRSLS